MKGFCLALIDVSSLLLMAAAALCVLVGLASKGLCICLRYAVRVWTSVMLICLVSFIMRGAGLAQDEAVVKMAAGGAVFAAVLCAWPGRFVAWVSVALAVVIAGVGLYEVCRGAPPLAGLLNVNHFGCFLAVALPIVLGMALHSGRQRRVEAGVLALFVVLLFFLLVASKCRTALAVSTLIMLGMGSVYAARLTFYGGFVILYAHAELLAGIIGTGDIRAV